MYLATLVFGSWSGSILFPPFWIPMGNLVVVATNKILCPFLCCEDTNLQLNKYPRYGFMSFCTEKHKIGFMFLGVNVRTLEKFKTMVQR
jgi:hypothetical protein